MKKNNIIEETKIVSPKELKNIRIKYGLTQNQMAELLKLSAYTRISEYERGKKRPSKQVLMIYEMIKQGKLKFKKK